MRFLVGWLLAWVMGTALAVAATAATADTCEAHFCRVTQGGFEQGVEGELPTGWRAQGGTARSASVAASAARSGNFGLQLRKDGPGLPGLSVQQPLHPVPAAGLLHLSAWLRSDAGAGRGGLYLQFRTPDRPQPRLVSTFHAPLARAGVWERRV